MNNRLLLMDFPGVNDFGAPLGARSAVFLFATLFLHLAVNCSTRKIPSLKQVDQAQATAWHSLRN
jgi:hypothetical protein